MITEDYVSREVAKLLKEKGFNESGHYEYHDKLSKPHFHKKSHNFNGDEYANCGTKWYSAPTHQMAMKWLREVYGLHISLEPCYDYDSMHVVFLAFVQNVADVHEFFDGRKNVASYPNAEKSYELAIKYCLENLI